MGEQNKETITPDLIEDLFEPSLADLSEIMHLDLQPTSSEKQSLVLKRRMAEQRLEDKRLRDELGDYDLELDDY
jgi:hypothetical protein